MNQAHQLMPRLKNLRLSGVLETLEVRNRQAIEEKQSYVDFLTRLLEDEVERRGQKQLSLSVRRSGLDPQKTLEAFDFGFNPTINRQKILDLSTCQFVQRAEPIIFIGQAGVGKSHLAQALGHEACRRGHDVAFVRASEMLAHLNGGRADGTYERRLTAFARPEVLIIDDFGLRPMRPPAPEGLFEIINQRYERGSIVLTTNRASEEWAELFAEPLLASAALDRLRHRAHEVVVTGRSYRVDGPRRETQSAAKSEAK